MTDKQNEETSAAVALASHSPGDSGLPRRNFMPIVSIKNPDGSFAGKKYFNCDADTFQSCLKGRQKGQRWYTFLKQNNEWAYQIRAWSRKNGNPPFLLRNEKDGTYIYAQKGVL